MKISEKILTVILITCSRSVTLNNNSIRFNTLVVSTKTILYLILKVITASAVSFKCLLLQAKDT